MSFQKSNANRPKKRASKSPTRRRPPREPETPALKRLYNLFIKPLLEHIPEPPPDEPRSDWRFRLDHLFLIPFGRHLSFCVVEERMRFEQALLLPGDRICLRYDPEQPFAEVDLATGEVVKLSLTEYDELVEKVRVIA